MNNWKERDLPQLQDQEVLRRARAVVSSAGRALNAVESARKRIQAEADVMRGIEAKRRRASKMIVFVLSALVVLIALALLLALHARSLVAGG